MAVFFLRQVVHRADGGLQNQLQAARRLLETRNHEDPDQRRDEDERRADGAGNDDGGAHGLAKDQHARGADFNL
ncbi:hypothetical protein SDC9_173780 [bioreactor metagenome]|uniref:Uncharacterized protein n=1 Tax=bioreactor metagenome TaxID=1076179 RepID=A0A645GJE1_9ZZZZ